MSKFHNFHQQKTKSNQQLLTYVHSDIFQPCYNKNTNTATLKSGLINFTLRIKNTTKLLKSQKFLLSSEKYKADYL